MVHGTVRALFQVVGASALALLLGSALLAWRLSQGPVVLDFLTPYIEESLSARDGSFSIRLQDTVLTWAGWSRALDIRARGVQALHDGAVVASVPEIAVTISGHALLEGRLAPRSIDLIGPRIRVQRGPGGVLRWGLGGTAASLSDPEEDAENGSADLVVHRLIEQLMAGPSDQATSHLVRLAVSDGVLVVQDDVLKATWKAPDADILLQRSPAGFAADLSLLVDMAGEVAGVKAKARYMAAEHRLDASAWFDDIRPAAFAGLGDELAPLAAADLPLRGTLALVWDREGGFETLDFDIVGDAGTLKLPAPLAIDVPVDGMALRGRLAEEGSRLRLDEFRLASRGATLLAAAIANPTADGGTEVSAEATVHNVAVDDLPKLWPAGLAPDPRGWVVERLTKGVVRLATLRLRGRLPEDRSRLDIEALAGELHPEGVRVDYLPPMPPLEDVSAVIAYDHSTFHIVGKSGAVGDLKLVEGSTVDIVNLDQRDQDAIIDLAIAGPLSDSLKLIDSPPLGYATAMGLKPDKVSGDAVTKLWLKVPLEKTVQLDDLSVKAHADLEKVAIPDLLLGQGVKGGKLALDVDGRGMDVKGQLTLGGVPGELAWRENFGAGAPFRSRYTLTAAAVDDEARRRFGLDTPPFQPPYLTGSVPAKVTVTLGKDGGEVESKLDLAPAAMALAEFGWSKEVGVPGGAEVTLKLTKANKLAAVPRFVVAVGGAAPLDIAGRGRFHPDGTIRQVEFDRLRFGRNDVKGSVAFRQGGGPLDIVVGGRAFDAVRLLDKGPRKPLGEEDQPLPAMTISATLDQMWLSEKGMLRQVVASMTRDAKDWRTAKFDALVGAGKPLSARLETVSPRKRAFSVSTEDGGAALLAMGLYENAVGGRLDLKADIDDSKSAQPISGRLAMSNYQVTRAPLLARLLTVAALTGILDVLRGEGISFTTLDMPFTLNEDVLELHEARAFGPSLGLTAKGRVDLADDGLAVEGTVVPAYAVNSALGNIPVIGAILTGEKGGGVFAATYSITGKRDDPKIAVNPLAALAPGVLRKFFELFENGKPGATPIPVEGEGGMRQ
ncbi:MAG: AsmA-like C-terminal domain-containing protein [Alphaproteobacteria bacterium]|nr:AsmA-like C-terminal domain-containing protein [Alphaproteobacteria bacterium]